jgi:hypothetical protein
MTRISVVLNILDIAVKLQCKIRLLNDKYDYNVEFRGLSFEDNRLLLFRNLDNNERLMLTINMINSFNIYDEECILIIKGGN